MLRLRPKCRQQLRERTLCCEQPSTAAQDCLEELLCSERWWAESPRGWWKTVATMTLPSSFFPLWCLMKWGDRGEGRNVAGGKEKGRTKEGRVEGEEIGVIWDRHACRPGNFTKSQVFPRWKFRGLDGFSSPPSSTLTKLEHYQHPGPGCSLWATPSCEPPHTTEP